MDKKTKLVPLLALLLLLSGCGSETPSAPEPTADLSVDISVPFTTVTQAPQEVREDTPDIAIDPNGNVTVYNDSLLSNDNQTVQADTAGYVTLQVGSSGEAVNSLQTRLAELDYYTGAITGIFDTETERAVRRFERTYGVMQTGLATPTLQTHLYSDSALRYGTSEYEATVSSYYNTLQRGSVGSAVYALQYRLKELGYPITELTAVYDEQTENAVKLFASKFGVTDMDVAYISLQKEIYSEKAPRYMGTEASAIEGQGETELSLGSTGTLVMQLQNRLISLGYMSGSASGVYDSETVTAVSLFQRVCGFEVTGSLPYYLQAVLLSDEANDFAVGNMSVVLSEGDEGILVTELQERLIRLGYANGSPSGVYDSHTVAALMLFQRYNHMEETGRATEDVQKAVYADSAISYKQALRILAGDATEQPTAPVDAATPTPDPDDFWIPAGPTLEPVPVPTPTPDVGAEPATPENGTPEPVMPDDEPGIIFEIADQNVEDPLSTLIPGFDNSVRYAKGSSGKAVKTIQNRLKTLGYSIKRTSKYDDQTIAAVKELQSHIGVTQTGEIDATLYAYLFSQAAPSSEIVMYRATQPYYTLQLGDSGESVERLQKQLSRLGYMLTDQIDEAAGVYDEVTEAAVKSAQTAMQYKKPDGVAGAEFQCFLFSEFNRYIKR